MYAMGTEVLRLHDCLNQRLGVVIPEIHPRRKSFYSNPRIIRKQAVRPIPDRSKRFGGSGSQSESSILKRSSSDVLKSTKNNNNNHLVGQMMILRRGELLDLKVKSDAAGTNRLGPEAEMVPKQIGINDLKLFISPAEMTVTSDMYAGSAFSLSPSPSSLPVPSFFKKKQVSPIIVNSATRDLRRILRLE